VPSGIVGGAYLLQSVGI